MDSADPRAQFPETNWMIVEQVRAAEDAGAHHALETLCRAYWYPLYAFARRSGRSVEDAQDLTQGFLAHALETQLFAAAEPQCGKLRTFLLTDFKHFLADAEKRARTQKRGGGCEIIPLETGAGEQRYACEPADPLTPEKLYERSWAETVFRAAQEALAARETRRGRGAYYHAFKDFLESDRPDGLTPAVAGRPLGLSNEVSRKIVERLRGAFLKRFREQIAETLHASTEARVDEELAALRDALRG